MRWPGRQPGDEERAAAVLGALCLFLSALEYLIPKPLPFMRIGFANAPLLLALDILSLRGFALLVLVKILGQALVSGSLFSYVFLFSLTGTVLSAALMYGLRRGLGRERTGLAGIGVLGALVSNASQIALARFFIFGEQAILLLPPFLGLGLVSGLFLGLFCERFTRRSRWYGGCLAGINVPPAEPAPHYPASPDNGGPENRDGWREAFRVRRRGWWETSFRGGELCAAGVLMGLLFLLDPSVPARTLRFLFFWFLAWLSGKRNNPLFTLSVILGIAAFNLITPYGRVLAEWGPLRITAGSLEGGIRKAVTVEGLVMLSAAAIRKNLRLPGPPGILLGESFRLLERLRAKKKPPRGDLIRWLDDLLLDLDSPAPASPAPVKSAGNPWPGRLFLAAAVLITAGLGALFRAPG